MMAKNEIVMVWDYETKQDAKQELNVIKAFEDYVKSIGQIRIKKVYANWQGIAPKINQMLYNLGYELDQITGKRREYNNRLVIHCTYLATKISSVKHFVIVSNKDHVELVKWLKDQGKQVTVIGKISKMRQKIMGMKKIISLEELSRTYLGQDKQKGNLKHQVKLSLEEGEEILLSAIRTINNKRKVASISFVGNVMKEDKRYSGIKNVIRDAKTGKTFDKLIELVVEVEKRGKVKIQGEERKKYLVLIEKDQKSENETSVKN